MPRKKKKSCLERKPSLLFTESPVHRQKNVPSPVLCARHPATATSVPVEQMHRLHWVSPQFRNVYSATKYGGRRRVTRLRRHSIAGHRLAGIANVTNPVLSSNRKLSKFRSLGFVGGKAFESSEAETVEVTINSGTSTDGDDNSDGASIQCSRCVRNKRTHDCSKQSNCIRCKKTSLQFGKKRTGGDMKENSENIDPLNDTANRLGEVERPPVKCLFASQIQRSRKIVSDSCVGNLSVDRNRFLPVAKSVMEGESINETARHEMEEVSNKTPECIPETETDEEIGSSPSSEQSGSPFLRRSERIWSLQQMLTSVDSPGRTNLAKKNKLVLAPDTPENEYGWSKRKRQLIEYLRKKNGH